MSLLNNVIATTKERIGRGERQNKRLSQSEGITYTTYEHTSSFRLKLNYLSAADMLNINCFDQGRKTVNVTTKQKYE